MQVRKYRQTTGNLLLLLVLHSAKGFVLCARSTSRMRCLYGDWCNGMTGARCVDDTASTVSCKCDQKKWIMISNDPILSRMNDIVSPKGLASSMVAFSVVTLRNS
jgi:hypothetical protein